MRAGPAGYPIATTAGAWPHIPTNAPTRAGSATLFCATIPSVWPSSHNNLPLVPLDCRRRGQFPYIYDNNFFLKQINLVSGSNSVVTPITRDVDGLVTGYGTFAFTRSGPAGATSQISDPAMNVAITYDSLGRVATRTHTVNGQAIYAIQLSYDNRGNISRKVETTSGAPTTWDYTYDADGQLTAANMNGTPWEIYSYDVNGNRTGYQMPGPGGWTLAASFDAQDRIIQQGQTTYQFNPDGQLIQRGSDTFQYSARGELLQATVAGQSVTYAYDGMGRRVARTDSAGTYQYLYGNLKQPFQLTVMRDPAGVLSTFYYDDAGLLFAMDKNGSRYYIATDQVGTPKAVSDSTGTVVKTMSFDSFGFPTLDSNPNFKLPVGFAGGLTDSSTTGLVRFGYRDYEPATGRWTAKDPIFFKGGDGNLLGYVQNNPINYRDPYGLFLTHESLQNIQTEASIFAAGVFFAPPPLDAVGVAVFGGIATGAAIADQHYYPEDPVVTSVGELSKALMRADPPASLLTNGLQ